MNRLLFLLVLVCLESPVLGQVLWSEDFEAEANGATSGTAGGTIGGTWTTVYGGAGTFSKQDPLGSNVFLVNNTDGEGVWTMSAPISIAATGRAIVETTVVGFLTGAGDYIRLYYRVDGGPEILFFEQAGTIASFTLTGTAIVTGSTLQVVIRSTTNGDFFGIDSYTVDNIQITGVNTLYSRKSGNWNDVSAGNGTWSAASLGGASCDCTPLTTDYVIVGNSNTVDINTSVTAGGIEIRNTGSVRYIAGTIDLNIDRGVLQVDNGGTINRNGQTGVQLDFDRGVVTTFINNGAITTENLRINGPFASINITGSGSIALTGDLIIQEDDIVVNNDLSGTFTIGDDLIFDQPGDFASDDAEFINRRTITVTSDIVVGANNDDGNLFTNASGATLNVVAINSNDANFNVSNAGTINQTGDFLNVIAASNYDNLATGTWNWNFVQSGFDAQLAFVLDCSAIGNTFVFGAAGNQSMPGIVYHHLTLSNSGTKSTTTNLDVNGNLLISGTSRLDPNTGNDNITLAGNWTVTSANADPFDEGTETVTLDGSITGQTINTVLAAGETFNNLILASSVIFNPQFTLDDNVTVATTLTMTSGVTNLNGATLTLTSNAAGSLAYTAGWVYGGTMVRATTNGAIAVGNVRGLFPMGNASNTRPFYVGKPAGTTTGTTTVVHNGIPTTTSNVSFADDVTITRRHDSFWTFATTVTGGANTWALRAGGTGFGTIADITHLRLSTASGVVGTPGTNSGTTANPLVERTALSIANLNANQFHVASVNAALSPLPIELTRFAAIEESGRVRLEWTTASELNNDFFTVERTTDAEHFEAVLSMAGKGTTTETTNYFTYDDFPFEGTSYYRLRQTDFDGTQSFSPLEKVVVRKLAGVQIYPNPVQDDVAILRLSGQGSGTMLSIRITDVVGRQVLSVIRTTDSAGNFEEALDTSKLAPGVYLVECVGNGGRKVLRMLVN